MAALKDSQLFKQIKQNDIKEVYFLFGEENYFIKKAVEMIKGAVVTPDMAGFNLTEIDGERLNISDLEDTLDQMPVMADKRCVLLKDLDYEKLVKEESDRLLELIKDPNPQVVFVIYNLSVEVNLKKNAKYKKFIEAVNKVGVTCEFAPQDTMVLKRALCERAKKEYVEMDIQTAEALIERCGTSYEVLSNEMDKLVAYANGGEITLSMVYECSIASIEASAFDLAKSVMANNFDRAYLILDDLFFLRQEAVAIISALAMAFADLYRAKCAIIKGKSADEVATDFNYPKNRLFAVKNAMRDINRYSISRLRVSMNALCDADIALKSSRLDNRLILEQMLGKMQNEVIKERFS